MFFFKSRLARMIYPSLEGSVMCSRNSWKRNKFFVGNDNQERHPFGWRVMIQVIYNIYKNIIERMLIEAQAAKVIRSLSESCAVCPTCKLWVAGLQTLKWKHTSPGTNSQPLPFGDGKGLNPPFRGISLLIPSGVYPFWMNGCWSTAP